MQPRDFLDKFDLENYVYETFNPVIHAGNNELRVNCFNPQGCANTDTKQHLYINTDKGVWHCFKCGYGSHREFPFSNWLPRFIADAECISLRDAHSKLELSFKPTPEDALSELIQNAFLNAMKPPIITAPISYIQLPKNFYPVHSAYKFSDNFQNFWLKRGGCSDDFKAFDLKYCVTQDSPWSNRVIIPVYDSEGLCRSALGRKITESKSNGSMAKQKKWYNWPKSDLKYLLWPFGHFTDSGNWETLDFPETVMIVEGIFDALAINRLTDITAVATFGKSISHQQIKILQSSGVQHLIVGWDKDAKKAIEHMTPHLSASFSKVSCFPYQDAIWDTRDFGDILMENDEKTTSILQNECSDLVDADSHAMLGWAVNQ